MIEENLEMEPKIAEEHKGSVNEAGWTIDIDAAANPSGPVDDRGITQGSIIITAQNTAAEDMENPPALSPDDTKPAEESRQTTDYAAEDSQQADYAAGAGQSIGCDAESYRSAGLPFDSETPPTERSGCGDDIAPPEKAQTANSPVDETDSKSREKLSGCGLLNYRKWWELIEVDISVYGKLITGIPIFIEEDTLRVINDDYSYFIPLGKVDYIRTTDGLRSSFHPPEGEPAEVN
jgi:hypothetical protein